MDSKDNILQTDWGHLQELAEFMSLAKLNERLRDPTLAPAFEGLLPRDNPRNTRFAINFFTSCGLGGLTDDLREFLRTQVSSVSIAACSLFSRDNLH